MIHTSMTQCHRFTGLPDIDTEVLLYLEHDGANRSGRITIVHFACAWTAFFTDLTECESMLDRLLCIPADKLARALQWGMTEVLHRERAKEAIFLRHLVQCIQQSVLDHIEAQRLAITPAPATLEHDA